MVYQADIREADITAVDTLTSLTELGADSPGNFDVPADVTTITEIRISAAPDWTADAMYGFSSAVHLSGPGFTLGGEYKFPGPVGGTAGAGATSAGNTFDGRPTRYLTNIPVSGGSTIQAQGALAGEDIGSLHVAVQLIYDGVPGYLTDYDYREENLTAANTEVSLQARAGTASGDFDVAGVSGARIVEVAFGGGVKSVAGPLRTIEVCELSGSGLKNSGYYRFLGHSGGVQDDVAISGTSWIAELIKYRTQIAKKAKGRINASAQMLEDDVGTVYAVCGLGYGV